MRAAEAFARVHACPHGTTFLDRVYGRCTSTKSCLWYIPRRIRNQYNNADTWAISTSKYQQWNEHFVGSLSLSMDWVLHLILNIKTPACINSVIHAYHIILGSGSLYSIQRVRRLSRQSQWSSLVLFDGPKMYAVNLGIGLP